jgi:hypothetical protein
LDALSPLGVEQHPMLLNKRHLSAAGSNPCELLE